MADDRIIGSIGVSVHPDASGFHEKLRRQLEPEIPEIGLVIGRRLGESMSDAIRPYLAEIQHQIDSLSGGTVRVRVDADSAAIAALRAELDSLRDRNVNVNTNDGGTTGAIAASVGNLGSTILGTTGKWTLFAEAAIAAADAAIPAILAVGAAAGGVLAGIGVGVLGLSGIGGAISAAGKIPSGGGGGGGGSGGQSQAAGLAIQAQQQQITQANATRSAQDQLTQAIQSQHAAELKLHDARLQALRDLANLKNQVADNALSQQQASIDLIKAEQTLRLDLASAGASLPQYALQIQQDRLNVNVAQQRKTDLSTQGSQLRQNLATAQTQGVNGNPNVLAAQQTLTDANHKLAEAQQNVTTTARQNQLQQEQLARQMTAAGAAAGAAGGAANRFAQAMSKLNPIQQEFVQFYLSSMKPVIDQFKLAASAFLPGVEQAFRNLGPAIGPITNVITQVAKAIGLVFENIATAIASPAGRQFINLMATVLPKQILFLGNLFIEIGGIIERVFTAAAPLIDAFDQALLKGLSGAGGGLAGFFNSLIPLIGPLFSVLGSLLGVLKDALIAVAPALTPIMAALSTVIKVLGPPVVQFLKAFADELAQIAGPVLIPLAQALGTFLQALEPILPPLGQLVIALGVGLAKIAGPVLVPLASALIALVRAVTPLIPVFANLINAVLPPLLRLLTTIVNDGVVPFVQALAAGLQPLMPVIADGFTKLAQALAPVIAQMVKDLIPILPALSDALMAVLKAVIPQIPVFAQLLVTMVPLIPPLAKLTASLLELAAKVIPLVTPALAPLIKTIPFFAGVLGGAVQEANAIVDAIRSVIDWFSRLLSSTSSIGSQLAKTFHNVFDPLANIVTVAFNGVDQAVRGVLNTIVDVVNKLITLLDGIHVHIPSILGFGGGDIGFNIPQIPHLAAGGPVEAGLAYVINEQGHEIFVPKVDGNILNNPQSQKLTNGSGNRRPTRNITNNIFGQHDPAATSHEVVNRMAARMV